MKISSFLLIFGIASLSISEQVYAEPGCLKAIQGRAIDEQAARLLPKSCQEFRKAYLKSMDSLSKNPKQFSKDLVKQILAKKSFEPPYDALVISSFPQNISEELKSAIHTRAQIETSKKVKYQYAVAAEERRNKGVCSPQFSDEAYDEVCRSKDLVYERIEKLQAVKGSVKK